MNRFLGRAPRASVLVKFLVFGAVCTFLTAYIALQIHRVSWGRTVPGAIKPPGTAVFAVVQVTVTNRTSKPQKVGPTQIWLIDAGMQLLIAHIVITLPYVVRTVTASLELADTSIEEAARTVGASRTQQLGFWRLANSLRGPHLVGRP